MCSVNELKQTIAVYKTDVNDPAIAETILFNIRERLPESLPSFDLHDCDKVLVVKNCLNDQYDQVVRDILQDLGHTIEVLP